MRKSKDLRILRGLELISANDTGVRWVSAQVESRLLEAIFNRGLHVPQNAAS